MTREDLSPSYQLAMTTHAALRFGGEYPHIVKNWEERSNSLVCLSVPNEEELLSLLDQLFKLRVEHYVYFNEPDINNEHVALACMVTPEVHEKVLADLPLALRDPKDPRWRRETALRSKVRAMS